MFHFPIEEAKKIFPAVMFLGFIIFRLLVFKSSILGGQICLRISRNNGAWMRLVAVICSLFFRFTSPSVTLTRSILKIFLWGCIPPGNIIRHPLNRPRVHALRCEPVRPCEERLILRGNWCPIEMNKVIFGSSNTKGYRLLHVQRMSLTFSNNNFSPVKWHNALVKPQVERIILIFVRKNGKIILSRSLMEDLPLTICLLLDQRMAVFFFFFIYTSDQYFGNPKVYTNVFFCHLNNGFFFLLQTRSFGKLVGCGKYKGRFGVRSKK